MPKLMRMQMPALPGKKLFKLFVFFLSRISVIYFIYGTDSKIIFRMLEIRVLKNLLLFLRLVQLPEV